jgi:nitrous oxidase accessory protein NosD
MADYPISNVPRRVQYVNSGVGPYAFTFAVLVQTDIAVYRGNTLLTLTTDYSVTINANGTGSITLVTAGTGSITIVGARAIQRSSDYTTGGDLFASTLNTDLDSQTIFSQQLAETVNRTIAIPVTDSSSLNMQLPVSTARANKLFGFTNSGQPVATNTTVSQLDAAVSSFVNATGNNAASIVYNPAGAGAVDGTVQSKLRQTVSVKDFGAVGDGVVDDSAAIQAAEDYASANKRNVYFPSGVYLCGTTIYRKGNTDWHGEGMYLSVLKHTGGLDTHEIIYTDNLDADYSHIGFYNMGFDGNRSGSVDPDTRRETVFLDRNAFGGDIAPSKDVRFIGCRIFNYSFNGHGLHIKGYTGVQIKDSIFEDGGGNVLFHPVYLLRAADVAITENVVIARTDSICIKVQRGTQVVVANNIVRDGSRGVFIQDGNQSAITGNSILDCVLGVALTSSGDGPDTKTTVVGNVIDGSETGVLVSGQTFGVISDNLITEFSSYGISLRATQEFNIVGNMLRTADSGVGNIDFIFLDAGPSQNRVGIIGNFLRNNRTTGTTNGIASIETVDGSFVSNNQLISVSPGWTSEFSGLNPIFKVERNQGLIVRGANRINNASQLEINGLADVTGNPAYSAYHWGNTNNAPSLLLNKSRSGTIGTKGSSVQDNDELGSVIFLGDHNDAFLTGVKIVASVDGVPTPGSDSMPARLIFQTRSSAGGAPQTRLTINSDGRIIPVLPTSSAGLPSGALWNDGGTVKVA